MLLAFDDTDSPTGGCTTRLVLDVLAALPELAPRRLPRLVRLNPNVPWKTRGNAAICLDLGPMEGPASTIGEWQGMELRCYPHAPPAPADEATLDAAWSVIEQAAQPDARPAAAIFDHAPAWWYEATVKTLVEPEAVADVAVARRGSDRASVGCVGAAAWPGHQSTFELIAYREPGRWGTTRDLDPAPFRHLDTIGATFHSWDESVDRAACIPRTPCPVLIGLRGTDADRLHRGATQALAAAEGEPIDAWILFETNQASGDHITEVDATSEAPAAGTIRATARVVGRPEWRPGGHVHVGLEDNAGAPFGAVAFEPTGDFRHAVAGLRVSDRVEVTGAWADAGVRLESVSLIAATPTKIANPEHCGRPMKSSGADAGYRCGCGHREPESATVVEPRETGSWEVPVRARRHLHRPLAWGSAPTPRGPRGASAPTSDAAP